MASASTRVWALGGGLVLAGTACWAAQRFSRRARSFRDHVVIITGGSRGLGLEMARLWGAEGARLALCARNPATLDRARRELAAEGCDVLTRVCDVTQQDSVHQFVAEVVDTYGRIDVLVNNAGIIQAGPLDCMTLDDFERAMATHFWGPLYFVDACLPLLRESGGQIVNIASIGGEVAVPHLAPYSASKFALVGLSEALATELRQAGVAVTTVCPGLMRTGSPRNAEFKGQHRAEYAWFSISDSLPLLSINSQVAARRIMEAARGRKPYLRVSWTSRLAAPARGLAPGIAQHLLSLVNRLLPSSDGGEIKGRRGHESFSAWSPSALTRLTELAAARNNELVKDSFAAR